MAPLDPLRPPVSVRDILATLWRNGHAAYVVGGGVRDELLGLTAKDWDVTTDALPARLQAVFPSGRIDNAFGTVTIPLDGDDGIDRVEATTFRRDHVYTDHRRPHSVTFTADLGEDLLRRDFTVNAIAWGKPALPPDQEPATDPSWADPTGGLADLAARTLRAVGDPGERFEEDALRLLRGARLAAQLDFEIEPATLSGMAGAAQTIEFVSRERIGEELRRMLEADRPSRAFEILAATGVLKHAMPLLDAQRGVPQDKAPGMDLWAHSMATLDAAARMRPAGDVLRLAALVHDIAKPETFADGHFIGHDTVGAEQAEAFLGSLVFPRRDTARVVELVRNHMFSYESRWSSAAVRRFIRRVGRDLVDDLIDLRAADNLGSGLPANAGHLDEMRKRVHAELDSGAPLTLADLAVNGRDLVAELSLEQGPLIGDVLEQLLGDVIADPAANTRTELLDRARDWLTKSGRQP